MSESIRAVYESGHLRLLDPVDLAEGEQVNVAILKETGDIGAHPRARMPARDLMKLPPAERNRILEAQAARAEASYRTDSLLTDFEALDDRDLYDRIP